MEINLHAFVYCVMQALWNITWTKRSTIWQQ